MELFRIADGRTWFYQWDLSQKIYVNDPDINEVHFCNGTSDCSLVVKVHEGLAEVPNILLQMARNIKVYAVNVDHTCGVRIFEVRARSKPADYVYTETEIKRYEDLEKQIEEVRRSIPSVPVKSVNGKTGEVKLNAADVGALPSDTQIPAPYSLPTASADIKGGVKVGNGLVMDGDALGVVEEEFDLIEESILDEPVSKIERSQEPNGEKYNFKKILVQFVYPKLSADYDTGYFEMKVQSNNKKIYAGYSAALTLKPNDKYKCIMTFFCEIVGGVAIGRNNVTFENSLEHNSRNHGPFANYVGNVNIDKIYFLNGNPYPIGCNIKIWAVRA